LITLLRFIPAGQPFASEVVNFARFGTSNESGFILLLRLLPASSMIQFHFASSFTFQFAASNWDSCCFALDASGGIFSIVLWPRIIRGI
jgi:hypothetical protein